MKKTYAFASALAVVLAGALSSCNNQPAAQSGESQTSVAPMVVTGERLPIAYVNVDSLLNNYDFAKDLSKELINKAEDSKTELNIKLKALDKKKADFQKKYDNQGFLSEKSFQDAYNAIQQEEAKLMQLNEQLQMELQQQTAILNNRMNDTIRNIIKEYNEQMHFELIFSNTHGDLFENLILDAPKYDITTDVLNILNERYAATKK